jgi:hypothetical protein
MHMASKSAEAPLRETPTRRSNASNMLADPLPLNGFHKNAIVGAAAQFEKAGHCECSNGDYHYAELCSIGFCMLSVRIFQVR